MYIMPLYLVIGSAMDRRLTLFVAVVLALFCSSAEAVELNKVLLNDAVNQGAMCLDGSPPGYFFRPGTGKGSNSWIVHLEGGGWCNTLDECISRRRSRLGSSTYWPATMNTDGFLSDDVLVNSGFYDWNVAFVGYCDGLSFAGYRKEPVDANGTMLHIRGFPVLQAVIDSLLKKGMAQAESVILTGCSAGGLATYLHADYVKSLLPESIKYHALADAGYFLDAPNIDGEYVMRQNVQSGWKFHNASGGLNQACVKANPGEEWKCLMAQYTYPHIAAPIFMLNSAYDTWQLGNILQLNCTPVSCSSDQRKAFVNYGQEFLKAAAPAISSPTNGVFVDSCLKHCQSLNAQSWSQIKVKGRSALETFSSWYFSNGGAVKEVDCAYPCNETC